MTRTYTHEDFKSLAFTVQTLLKQAVTKESPTVQGISDVIREALFAAFESSPGHFKGAMAELNLHVVDIEDTEDKNGYLIVSIDNRDSEPNEDLRRTLVIYSSKELFTSMAEDMSPENMRRLKFQTFLLSLRNAWQRFLMFILGIKN